MKNERHGYELVWSDEFDKGEMADPETWIYEEGFCRNEELQFYTTARKENARIEDGCLVIEGRKEAKKTPNPKLGKGWAEWQRSRTDIEYTSASLTTRNSLSLTYGRVEVRAELPKGKGAWPAIWMLGTNIETVGWPACGEIDVMEWLGRMPDTVHGTAHYPNPAWKEGGNEKRNKLSGGKVNLETPPVGFHVYAIEWDQDKIEFLLDGKTYHVFAIDDAGKGPDNPFRKPMYLLINLALGGIWGEALDDTALPMIYKIDYVRVYKKR